MTPFIKNSTDYLHELKDYIANPHKMNGIPSVLLPSYTKILKGFRLGELTVLTGPTGSGKTTVLSQLSLDFAVQNVPTLWGSFEIKNTKLLRKMLCQYSGKTIEADSIDTVHKNFSSVPMYFLDFFGSTPLEQVLPILYESCEKQRIQHIIIDNLQFMLSGQDSGVGDKYDLMDKTVAALRRLANEMNVHVSLVIHPKKELDGCLLGISSFYGSTKPTQEADNVVIIQKDLQNNRFIDIKKNRFDGEVGSFPIVFDPISCQVKEGSKQNVVKNFQPRPTQYPTTGVKRKPEEALNLLE